LENIVLCILPLLAGLGRKKSWCLLPFSQSIQECRLLIFLGHAKEKGKLLFIALVDPYQCRTVLERRGDRRETEEKRKKRKKGFVARKREGRENFCE